MTRPELESLKDALREAARPCPLGRITALSPGRAVVSGLPAALGDGVEVVGGGLRGEVVGMDEGAATVLLDGEGEGLAPGAGVVLRPGGRLGAGPDWLGRTVDPAGAPLDGLPAPAPRRAAPAATGPRGPLGGRLRTGLAAFDAFLPLCLGQRIGLFAGAGVGKSTLLTALARDVAADCVVIALVGEREHEIAGLRRALAEAGARALIVAAPADAPPLLRRRAPFAAMEAAEALSAEGRDVLFLCDSVTRLAEAEREVAIAAGAPLGPGGHAPWTPRRLTTLAERAGPGRGEGGAITAVLSVLVPGEDMADPVADVLRGVLDGHVVLSRAIAERGRFPAIDLLRSLSRALPGCAAPDERPIIAEGRRRAAAREEVELMVRSGLYEAGADAATDRAVRSHEALEGFLSSASRGPEEAVARLAALLAETAAP
ncbi:flagellum-specific ATP synthase [Hasllibacter halocynthiae]|uniref:Flagellum-specific ATP synthase n=1 Tax=Hasllibacter halocynthiae TaxID=595589 RepID=A0A2T0X2S8_9RHOB|nr:flagellum-specific ATP synthase FliI [Hasllibacter halocynthiae]PRY93217.1 flagellum-specific ATP synthase [Hasllibacter halocynthiae]